MRSSKVNIDTEDPDVDGKYFTFLLPRITLKLHMYLRTGIFFVIIADLKF